MASSRDSSVLGGIKLLYFHFPAATFLLISILWPCFRVSEQSDFVSVDAPSVTGPQLASPLLCRSTLLLSLLFAVTSYRFVFLSRIWNSWVRIGFFFKASDTLLNSLPDTVAHPPTACEHACPPPVWQPWELWILDAISSIHKQWCCISTVKTETFPFVYWLLLLLSWRTQSCTLPIIYWGFTFFFFRLINFNLLIFVAFKCINPPHTHHLSCLVNIVCHPVFCIKVSNADEVSSVSFSWASYPRPGLCFLCPQLVCWASTMWVTAEVMSLTRRCRVNRDTTS